MHGVRTDADKEEHWGQKKRPHVGKPDEEVREDKEQRETDVHQAAQFIIISLQCSSCACFPSVVLCPFSYLCLKKVENVYFLPIGKLYNHIIAC